MDATYTGDSAIPEELRPENWPSRKPGEPMFVDVPATQEPDVIQLLDGLWIKRDSVQAIQPKDNPSMVFILLAHDWISIPCEPDQSPHVLANQIAALVWGVAS